MEAGGKIATGNGDPTSPKYCDFTALFFLFYKTFMGSGGETSGQTMGQ